MRTTPWLSPADEQKQLVVPPGFEIQLVAAEPDIHKPLNMAFDERGRLWLTCTLEYPYAAPPDRAARDSIKVLEDTDGDGRFEKITTFADGLNIPIGIYPYKRRRASPSAFRTSGTSRTPTATASATSGQSSTARSTTPATRTA